MTHLVWLGSIGTWADNWLPFPLHLSVANNSAVSSGAPAPLQYLVSMPGCCWYHSCADPLWLPALTESPWLQWCPVQKTAFQSLSSGFLFCSGPQAVERNDINVVVRTEHFTIASSQHCRNSVLSGLWKVFAEQFTGCMVPPDVFPICLFWNLLRNI